MGTENDLVQVSSDGNVALLRLNRPEARNALSPEVMEELASALERLDPNPEVRCVVIAGSGKVFAAGADIKAMAERSFAEALRHPAAVFGICREYQQRLRSYRGGLVCEPERLIAAHGQDH